MGGCPICGRTLDGSLTVYAPPSTDAFDTIDCARRGAKSATQAPAALVLPTIDVVTSLGPAAAARSAARRLAPLPLAVAAGLTLVAAGTASSLALWSSLPASPTRANLTAAPAVTSSTTGEAAPPPASRAADRPAPVVADPIPPTRAKTSPRFKGVVRIAPRESPPAPIAPTSTPVAWQPEATGPPPPPSSAAPEPAEPESPSAHAPRPTQKPKPHLPAPPPPPASPTSQPSEGGQTPADHGDPPALSPPAHSAGQPGHHDAQSDEDGKAKKEKEPKKQSDGGGGGGD